jgi:acyl-CoA thioesterase
MHNTNLEDILGELEKSPSNETSFSDDWSQGRAAYGGLAAALATTAMRKELPLPQTIRSLMVSFIAPVASGDVSVESKIVRQGKNVTQCSASVISGGQVGLQAMAAFGNSREAFNPAQNNIRDLPDRESGIFFSDNARRLPHFLRYFEGCWIDGGIPFSGVYKPFLSLWVRHEQDVSKFPVEKLIAIADIPPPVLLSHFDKPPVPASSLSWSLEFIEPPESITSEWFFLDFEVDAAANGYTQQSGKIYEESGRLIALTRQCMVYFG